MEWKLCAEFNGMKKTVIVDFESGNLFSVFHACRLLGLNPVISNDPKEIGDAAGVILPELVPLEMRCKT